MKSYLLTFLQWNLVIVNWVFIPVVTNKRVLLKDTTIKICDDLCLVVNSSFAFYVITFEPIEVQIRSAPQNDHLNFSCVKDVIM